MEVDKNGNVYVTGEDVYSGDGIGLLVKYNTNGDTAWIKEGDVSEYDILAIQGNGDIVTAGTKTSNIVVKKISPSGNEYWNKTFDFSGTPDVARTIKTDNANNIYVAGVTYVTNKYRLVILKLNADGDLLWSAINNSGTLTTKDSSKNIRLSVDKSGNVFATVKSNNSTLLKYNSSGTLQWSKTSGTGFSDMVTDTAGNVYAIGSVLLKYNSTGAVVWTRSFSGGGNSWWEIDNPKLGIDSGGNIIARGISSIVKYSPAGIVRWQIPYTTLLQIGVTNFAINNNSDVFLTGDYASGSAGNEVSVVKIHNGKPYPRKYRSFLACSLLSDKVRKIQYRRNVLVQPPNLATILYNEFVHLGKFGSPFLGVKQVQPDSIKKYAWVEFTKADNIAKLYTSAHDTTKVYPLDSLRIKKPKALAKAIKPDRKNFNNFAIEQGVIFNLNLLASRDTIIPFGFGSLTLDSNISIFGKNLNNKTLKEIGKIYDTLMTYWLSNGINNVAAYAELSRFAKLLRKINTVFYTPIAPGNYFIDSANVVKGKKNPYAVSLLGYKNAESTLFLKDASGKERDEFNFFSEENLPNTFSLYQNYPNPFNPVTVIRYQVPVKSIISLKMYNILGQEVVTLMNNEEIESGIHHVTFDASGFSSGVYFYRLSATVNGKEAFAETKKLLLIR